MCAISVSNQNMLTLLPDSQMTNYGDHTPFHSICKLSQTFFFFPLTMQVPAIDGLVKDMSLPLRILGDSSYTHSPWPWSRHLVLGLVPTSPQNFHNAEIINRCNKTCKDR